MSKATATARKVASKVAFKLEKLVHEVWEQESHLTAAGGSGTDPEAVKLSADFACIAVDRIHPAIEALRKAAEPMRQPEEESEDEPAPLPEALA